MSASVPLVIELCRQNLPLVDARTEAAAVAALHLAGLDELLALEQAVSVILPGMHLLGLKVDEAALRAARARARQTLAMSEARLGIECRRFGLPRFNVRSDKAALAVLQRLRFPLRDVRGRTLRALEHPLASAIADCRDAHRTASFLDKLARFVRGGVVRGSFDQLGSVSGRFGCHSFELMGFPRLLRHLIVARPGCLLGIFDCHAYEMFILAGLSRDPMLAKHLATPDFYRTAAAALFGVAAEAVDGEMRASAKVATLAINYGRSAFSLQEEFDCDYDEAQGLIDDLRALYGVAEAFLAAQAEAAVEARTIATPLGRRRYFGAKERRDRVKRQARNYVVQGHAADIFKDRLVALATMLTERNWGSILLPLHDAFLVEIPEDAVDEAVPEIKRLLETSPLLAIPLRTTAGIGRNWAEAEADAKKRNG